MPVINEWSPLKKVIVGVADGARHPKIDLSVRIVNNCEIQDENDIPSGLFDQQIIDEANEDLDKFVDVLVSQNIEVLRPNKTQPEYYNFCPRDSVFLYDDITIATPMPTKPRKDEWKAFGHHLNNVINIDCSHSEELYNPNAIGPVDGVLAITEHEPAFDAANIIKANDHILYLVSNTGNKKGAHLLQEHLGNRATVHMVEDIYAFSHIDSTVTFLREGLMLLNPSRVKDKTQLPKPFQSWDVIWSPEPVVDPTVKGMCSPWVLTVNLASINENLVCIEENQIELKRALEKHKIDSIGLPGRQSIALGGGFHCVTLDLDRDY